MSEQIKFKIFEDELLKPLAGHELGEMERYIASLLLSASTHRPIGLTDIINQVHYNLGKRPSERFVKAMIRTLRKNHKFPILARRKQPAGYWWCANVEEMKAFIETYRKAALDELHTLSQIIHHNYPALQGQLTFEDHGQQ